MILRKQISFKVSTYAVRRILVISDHLEILSLISRDIGMGPSVDSLICELHPWIMLQISHLQKPVYFYAEPQISTDFD
jgi:hypothetical protein